MFVCIGFQFQLFIECMKISKNFHGLFQYIISPLFAHRWGKLWWTGSNFHGCLKYPPCFCIRARLQDYLCSFELRVILVTDAEDKAWRGYLVKAFLTPAKVAHEPENQQKKVQLVNKSCVLQNTKTHPLESLNRPFFIIVVFNPNATISMLPLK